MSGAQCTAHEKKLSKKIIFSKFFLLFIINLLQTICTPNFVKIGQLLIFEVHSALNCLKIKNCPILTKFGMHIVWSGLIVKSKKNFEKNQFFGQIFFMGGALCATHFWNFEKKSKISKYLLVWNLIKIRGYARWVHFA